MLEESSSSTFHICHLTNYQPHQAACNKLCLTRLCFSLCTSCGNCQYRQTFYHKKVKCKVSTQVIRVHQACTAHKAAHPAACRYSSQHGGLVANQKSQTWNYIHIGDSRHCSLDHCDILKLNLVNISIVCRNPSMLWSFKYLKSNSSKPELIQTKV